MPELVPVDHDPFAQSGSAQLVPVDHDPFAPAASPMTAGETAADVAKSAGIGLVKGGIGLAGLPGDVGGLLNRGIDYATSKLGLSSSPSNPELFGSGQIQHGIESETGEFYQPKSRLGRFAETAGEFAPALIGGPETLGAKLATRVAAPAVVGQSAAELARGTKFEPYAKVVGAVTGAAGAAGIGSAVRGAFSPQTNVVADLGRALERDGATPESLWQKLQETRQIRPEATLADVGGENVRGLVERVAQTPGAGRTTVVPALTARQQAQMGRLSNDLTSLTGTRQSATQAIEQTMAARKADAAPLYDIAMDFNARAVPEVVDAWQRETASGWGAQILKSPDFRRNLQTEYGITNPANAPLMKVIDAWKKGADDLVNAARRAGNNNRARVIGDMRDRVVSVLDEHNSAYAAARNAWAGPSRYLEGIEDGRNILSSKISAEELTAKLGAGTDADREAYRIGAVSAIRGKMGNDPAKLADMTKSLRSPEMRAKISAIMPTPEAAQAFTKRLDYEVGSSELVNRAQGNSATARRLAERKDADSLPADLLMGALTHGATWGLAKHGLMALPQRVRDTLRSRSDALLAELLVTPQAAKNLRPTLQGVKARSQSTSALPSIARAAAYSTPLRLTVRPQDRRQRPANPFSSGGNPYQP